MDRTSACHASDPGSNLTEGKLFLLVEPYSIFRNNDITRGEAKIVRVFPFS